MADTTFGYFNQTAGYAQAGYGLYKQIDRALHGDKYKVHFLLRNKAVIEFDACLNESHSQEAAPTAFPLQSGASVTDHIAVAPLTLSITGVVTDSPITDAPDIKLQTVIAGSTLVASKVASAAGVLGVAAAFGLNAQRNSVSRSLAAYSQLTKMISGYVNGYQVSKPQLFTVVTRLRSYTEMALTELRVDRDSSTGNALVFSMNLMQVRRAYSTTLLVSVAAEPEKAAVLSAQAAENDANKNKILDAERSGLDASRNLTGDFLFNYARGL